MKRLLIIEDNVEILRSLSAGITKHDFVCVSSPDGISAIREIHNSQKMGIGYDVVILDIFLPDIDGMKILQVVKYQYPDLPVIVITGFGDKDLENAVLAFKNTAYLEKPFTISHLKELILNLPQGNTTSSSSAEMKSEYVGKKYKAYLTLRINDSQKSQQIYDEIFGLPCVSACEAVKGNGVDITAILQGEEKDSIILNANKIGSIKGIEMVALHFVESPKLEKEMEQFIRTYWKILKDKHQSQQNMQTTLSYLWMDIQPDQMETIFTTVCLMDNVLSLDVLEGSTQMVAMICGSYTARSNPVMEKLKQVDGVLRLRESKIIQVKELHENLNVEFF